MSLEAKIEALTDAVNRLAGSVQAGMAVGMLDKVRSGELNVRSPNPTPVAPTPAPQPMQQNVPQVTHSAPPAAAMPPPPSFAPPQPAPVPAAPQQTGAPFNDIKGLIAYAMETYKAIGPQKGAGIQTILQNLGYSNINSVAPEHFGQFYAAVEGLKA